ncbi:MAG TPA: CPBP family intramembrane glutamic endopeptidase [Chitinophagales bacterium]|nr:CPBP family intramembrane glutamic endopeptidase [Chitinophagales bacterium]
MTKTADELKQRRMVVLFSVIALTVVYWFTALWYNNKTGNSKDLIVFHWLFGRLFPGNPLLDLWQYFYQFAITVILFFAVPAFIIKRYLKEDYNLFRLKFVRHRQALIICAVIYPVVVCSTYFTTTDPTLAAEYPLSKLIHISWATFIIYEMAYFFYFFSYEAFFRGYLQFGLASEKPGIKEIIYLLAIQTIITTLFHIGKPTSEIMAAAAFGPIIGYVALRYNTIWYGLGIHYLMNIFIDYFILYHRQMLPQKFFW